jgi:hypothetical protein
MSNKNHYLEFIIEIDTFMFSDGARILVQGGQDFYFLFLYIFMKKKKTKCKQKLIKNIKKYN